MHTVWQPVFVHRLLAQRRFDKRPLASIAAAVLVALSGCQTAPISAPAVPAPSLQLIDSKPLLLADDCSASGSFFVGFTVLPDGRTDDLSLPAGPLCVREALAAWVASFRYAPPPTETAAGVEWMLVSASRGS